MRYWDSSSIVPLLVEEAGSEWAWSLIESDPEIVTWWATLVECTSAIARLERSGQIQGPEVGAVFTRLNGLADGWTEISPTDTVRERARRLLRVHPLRAGDALQLAAALSAAEGYPETLPFVSLDDRQVTAADREALSVVRFDPS